MFDSPAFNVVIGLVLIYLLYSLLVTIVGETVATWMGLRSRMLRAAIERMLNDEYNKKKKDPLYSLMGLLKESNQFKSSFAGRFYDYPSIKYLSKSNTQFLPFIRTKPSYISAENFADTLINILAEKGVGKNNLEKISFALRFNTLHIQQNSAKQIKNLLNNSENLNGFRNRLMNWFNETMDRTNGWYKNKFRGILFVLGFLIALSFNVDSIRIAKILSKDKGAREQLVNMGVALTKDTARYKGFVHSNGDSIQSNSLIDTGFAQVSKDIGEANMILGLSWGLDRLYKTASFEITNCNPNIYNQAIIKKGSFNVVKDSVGRLKDTLQLRSKNLQLKLAYLESLKNNLIIDSLEKKVKEKTLTRALIDTYKTAIFNIITKNKTDSFLLNINLKLLRSETDSVLALAKNDLAAIDSITLSQIENNKVVTVFGKRHYGIFEKIWFVIGNIFSLSFFGFFITSIAICLGAPFWFGVLNTLVSIRGSGVKPEEKKDGPNSLPENINPLLIQIPVDKDNEQVDKLKMALDNLTQKVKNEKDIVAVAIQYKDPDHSPFLMVFVENNQIGIYAQTKYGNIETVDETFSIPIDYYVTGHINVQTATSGSKIKNASLNLGSGTLGCNMKKKGDDNNYFISCWHVMKDNTSWADAPINSIIINVDDDKKKLGIIEKEGGFLSHDPSIGIDIGIAKYLSNDDAGINDELKITGQHRPLSSFDSLVSTPVKLFGNQNKLKEAIIFHDQTNARIKYPDGNTYLMNDVFSITMKDANTGVLKSPTTSGDSGAVVTDTNGIPLGMVIGGNGIFSYAIKFSNVFDSGKPFANYYFKF